MRTQCTSARLSGLPVLYDPLVRKLMYNLHKQTKDKLSIILRFISPWRFSNTLILHLKHICQHVQSNAYCASDMVGKEKQTHVYVHNKNPAFMGGLNCGTHHQRGIRKFSITIFPLCKTTQSGRMCANHLIRSSMKTSPSPGKTKPERSVWRGGLWIGMQLR